MIEPRLWRNLDYILVGSVMALLIISLLVLSSASSNMGADPYHYVKRQLGNIFIGLIGLFLVLLIDYQRFAYYRIPLYIFNLILLGSVIFMGDKTKGAQRWIDLGFYQLQPSEFAKLLMIIILACFLQRKYNQLNHWRDMVLPFIYIGIPVLLILKQPDLGTALVLMAIFLGMLYIGGTNTKILLLIFGGGLLLVGVILYAHYNFGLPVPLENYQLQRLVVFLNPYNDGQGGAGAGYHIIQSQIAIGSGGWWGLGFNQGSQVQLNFLPEHHTDFIFSVIGEELGFIRTTAILGLYIIILYRMIRIAAQAKDVFGALLVSGVAFMYAFHILINVGMTIGIMPVTGIPLPLLSYGGSAIMVNMLALGVVLNVNLRRQKILF